MTLFTAFTDSNAAGTRFSLADSDNILIKAGTTTARSDFTNYFTDAVIRATGNKNTYDIRGALAANASGIIAGDNAAQDAYHNIVVAETGEITSYNAIGIQVNAFKSSTLQRVVDISGMGLSPLTSPWVVAAPMCRRHD